MGEYFASGYFELPDASPMRRWSRAVRRRFERRALGSYRGELLYPSGPKQTPDENRIVTPSFSFTWQYNENALSQRLDTADPTERQTLEALRREMRALNGRLSPITTAHTLGGGGYTHSIPNYGRVLREGLNAHARRIENHLASARERGDADRTDFYLGLSDVLGGVEEWRRRIVAHLLRAECDDGESEARRDRLVAAYTRVPFEPARDFFEAIVAYNFTFYLDGCDNPGRVDQELHPYYARNGVTHERAVALIRVLWENVDANNGWSTGIGGTTPNGDPAYNEVTLACLEAAHSIRRPNLQLHVRRDMPPEFWDAAIDTIATGCGLPALHNEEEYLESLRETDLGVKEEDLSWHNGGGCTETMIHGMSNVGSLDAGINLPLILVDTLDDHLATASSSDELLSEFRRGVTEAVREITEQVSANQEAKARWRPQPMRSLLIDDCIDSGREFNAGGARYNWSVVNVGGLANVVDSLAAVREVVFEKCEDTGAELLDVLHRDFEGCEPFRRRLERCPRFGNDDAGTDDLAADIGEFVFREFLRCSPWRGGKFLPSCLMFTTYARAGEPVAATPDGRRAGTPIADSAGPMQGRDRNGPTAMLKSVTRIPHRLAPGTLVVNARFSKQFFATDAGRAGLKEMIRTYFDLGGMQIQINVVDQEVLKDAVAHPERHQDLVVRVGGFSEYFNRLSPELKHAVLERVEHDV